MFENGKSYSALRQTCLELAALSIKLSPLKNGAKANGNPVFVLFNEDRTKVELFFPNEDKGHVLKKTNIGNWAKDEFKLISWKGYVVQQNGKAIFGGP